MRKREPERRSTKSFAQDRGSTELLRAHNASARAGRNVCERAQRKKIFDKNAAGRRFEWVLRQKQRSKGSSRSPYCLLGSKVKRSVAVCGAANKAGQRARVELQTSFEALALKAAKAAGKVFGYVSRSRAISRMRSERENGAYFSKHARRRGKKRCARQSSK